ncbi:O-antigen ligase family protein [Aureimonas phyllosphaerae]|uniref:O-antigen ligase-related domain-containing protein n=1 Tax=Aureimonas phyllosphaerae TaxID=1166078 RepID=A0A7W6C075_9HYPH|nr:O-antigen ligase family protein [Aureimonas phyllosphaerae]MBB3938020.1 hypothetical protein [Aureimonas phyllosphaerae]MBB3962027.1 hypothetical protein [Aureimonas phyllosphaerae]SFF54016.1 O-antigen ligase [Aureimonas phyllosphaerae]
MPVEDRRVDELRQPGRRDPAPPRPLFRERDGEGAGLAGTTRLVLVGRTLFILALVLCIALRGAVSPLVLLGVVCLVGVSLAVGALSPPVAAATLRSYRLCILVAGGLALYLVFQSWSFLGNPFANPLWSRVDRLLGADVAAISVAPATTRGALFTLVAPFLVFSAGLALFQRDEGGVVLLRWLTAMGVAFAVFGLLQVAFFPRSLLFSEKTAYLDSLTASFVNRNTAGTFLGVASFAVLTLALRPVRQGEVRYSFFGLLTDPDAPAPQRRSAFLMLSCLFAILFALFLTRSRGALLATAIAYVAIIPFLILDSGGSRPPAVKGARSRLAALGRPAAVAVGVAILTLGVVGLFGGLTIHRMETRGVDAARLCVYWSMLDAIGQNWRFGTGFGTFESVFPIYRSAGCGAPGDVFLRAHNIYLEALLGLGIGFVPLLIGGALHIVGNFVAGLRRRRSMRVVPIIALGAVALVALHSLVDFSLQIPGMAAFFAAYLAAATTISLGRGRGSATSRRP